MPGHPEVRTPEPARLPDAIRATAVRLDLHERTDGLRIIFMYSSPLAHHRPTRSLPSNPALTRPGLTRRSLLSALGAGSVTAALAACGSAGGSGGSDKPVVVTGCYALTYITEQVAGDSVEIMNLAKPGVDPHGLELSVAEVAQLQEADLILQIPGFQAALDDAIESKDLAENTLDLSEVIDLLPAAAHGEEDEHDHEEEGGEEGHEEHDHGAFDPHFWFDPTRLAAVGDAIGERLAEIDPDHADTFSTNATDAHELLGDLDAELEESFGAVDGEKDFVTSHTAFAYLADRYGLEQIGITGIDPEVEPSPKRLLELQKVIEDKGVSTVYFETTASPKVAQTLAENVGVEAEELDNLETQVSEDTDYAEVMRETAEKLVAGWS